MVLQKKVVYMVIGGLLALVLAFAGAATFAQTDDNAETETPSQESDETTPVVPDEDGLDLRGFNRDGGLDRRQALVDALGITLEELQAAQTEAKAAAVAQAVTDGLITQEQADEILANGGRGRGLHMGDNSQYLADALDISVEDLQAAVAEVEAAQLAAMVEAGAITQEQADMITARRAVENRIDRAALQAAVQSAYEDAINQALSAGEITQEQADALLTESANFGLRGFGGSGFGFGGRGGHHHGPRGGGFAPFQNDGTSAPATTDTSSDA